MDEEDYDEEEYDEELFEGETILLRLEKTNDGDVLVGIEDDDEFEKGGFHLRVPSGRRRLTLLSVKMFLIGCG